MKWELVLEISHFWDFDFSVFESFVCAWFDIITFVCFRRWAFEKAQEDLAAQCANQHIK